MLTNQEYRAIRRAARHIERSKKRFDFWGSARPADINGVGCPAAWIGFFLDMPNDLYEFAALVAKRLGFRDLLSFLQELDAIDNDWHYNNRKAAKVLRQFADNQRSKVNVK